MAKRAPRSSAATGLLLLIVMSGACLLFSILLVAVVVVCVAFPPMIVVVVLALVIARRLVLRIDPRFSVRRPVSSHRRATKVADHPGPFEVMATDALGYMSPHGPSAGYGPGSYGPGVPPGFES